MIADLGMSGQRIGIGCECKKMVRLMRVMELPHAYVVAGAEKSTAPLVPDRKGEIAPQMLDTILAPPQVRQQYQLAVAYCSADTLELQLFNQPGSIVEACICSDKAIALGVAQR
jgi:hypothetical protein